MKTLVVGATGALGRPLVRQLVAAGHEVLGTTRSARNEPLVRAAGAKPVVLDALDRDAVLAAVAAAAPDVIIHQATALSAMSGNPRRFDDDFETTNRLRTTGLEYLLEAAGKAGTGRVLVQSYTGWPNQREGSLVKSEDDALDPDPPKSCARTLDAIRTSERLVTEAGGLALRYGAFYGPGSNLFGDGAIAELIRRRRFPILGKGTGMGSFIHLEDAAAATVAALDHGAPGVYNIVDDDPAPVSEWLPHLAAALGAKPPMRLPVWLGRLAAGELAVAMMTQSRGSSNAKAKRELGWTPAHPSWREGFIEAAKA